MWANTRLVVFTAISAALYAAILIPFKVLPIIPGVTEFRPANAVPVVCSFLFGPAAAWGSPIGNLIGDLFAGGIGPGDIFGFAGNLLYGLIPYRAWDALGGGDPMPRRTIDWLRLAVVIFVASAACALLIGWGLNLLGFMPFPVIANFILWNNFLVAVILAPLLLRVIYPRVKAGRLTYRHLLTARKPRSVVLRSSLFAIGAAATIGGHVAGNLIHSGMWSPFWVDALQLETANRAPEIGIGLLPFVLVAFVCFLAL